VRDQAYIPFDVVPKWKLFTRLLTQRRSSKSAILRFGIFNTAVLYFVGAQVHFEEASLARISLDEKQIERRVIYIAKSKLHLTYNF
jgi:hypothetical protein